MQFGPQFPIGDSTVVTACSKQANDLRDIGVSVVQPNHSLFSLSHEDLKQLTKRRAVIVPPSDAAWRSHAESAFSLIDEVATFVSYLKPTDLQDGSEWNPRPTPSWAHAASYMATSTFPPRDTRGSALMPLDMLHTTSERRGPAPTIVTEGKVTLVTGADPDARTAFGLGLACHVAAGEDIANQPIIRGSSVFISLDQSGEELAALFRRVVETAGLNVNCVLENFRAVTSLHWKADGDEAAAADPRDFPFLAAIKKHFFGTDLVVIDSAQLALGGDDNRSYRVAAFIQALKAICSETGSAVLLLCRDGKNGSKGVPGTVEPTMWTDIVRSHISLQDEGKALSVTRIKPRSPGCRVLAEIFVDAQGRFTTLPPGALEQEVRFADEAAVLAACNDAMNLGFTVPTATTGPKTAWHILQQFDSLGSELRNVAAKSRVHSALARLAINQQIFQSADPSQPKGKANQWVIW